jgi:hypothetical protein
LLFRDVTIGGCETSFMQEKTKPLGQEEIRRRLAARRFAARANRDGQATITRKGVRMVLTEEGVWTRAN